MKRGAIEMEQIVKLIIPIIAFIIVVGWLMYVGLQDLKKDDICHASVLGRAQTKSLGEVAPLKCEVNKFCVSDSNGKCEEVFVGEKINKISLSSKRSRASLTSSTLKSNLSNRLSCSENFLSCSDNLFLMSNSFQAG